MAADQFTIIRRMVSLGQLDAEVWASRELVNSCQPLLFPHLTPR